MHFTTLLSSALLVASSSAASTYNHSSSTKACKQLSSKLGSTVSYPNSATYKATQADYYDRATPLPATCIFTPRSTADVSAAIKILTSNNAKFAIKAAGHMSGYNSIADGVLISLTGMKKMEWKEDDEVLSIGPGLSWGEVYPEADKKGKTVIGGRVSSVGVSGLLLGGGISFASAEFGFACDNVKGYEVVLASGQTVYATSTSHPTLYRALRGGSSNFGIVTRFDLDTHPVHKGWGGWGYMPLALAPDAVAEMDSYNAVGAASDFHSGAIMTTVTTTGNIELGLFILWHSSPPSDGSVPAVFAKAAPYTVSDMSKPGANTLGEIVAASSAAGGAKGSGRNHFATYTVKASKGAVEAIQAIASAEAATIADVVGLQAATAFQPITEHMISTGASRRGGNVLGLEGRVGKEGLMALEFSYGWQSPDDDERVLATQKRILEKVEKWAQEKGLGDRWLYLNDAGPKFGQKAIQSYGPDANKFLKQVKKQYDPKDVFTKLMPGGFKL